MVQEQADPDIAPHIARYTTMVGLLAARRQATACNAAGNKRLTYNMWLVRILFAVHLQYNLRFAAHMHKYIDYCGWRS